ncbi:MAG: GGDEF domain-containing protein [Desulfovibrionaceae bacterium]|nr:GGDEF domain-containing protein [Desulfovibrionaceae bacterium]
MSHVNIAEHILSYLDIAVLRREDPGRYTVQGEPPDFYQNFFPATGEVYCSSPWDHSYMLAFFFERAEEFFSQEDADGMITSGTWEEEGLCGEDEALVAEAIAFQGTQVITLRLLRDIYQEHAAILRKARWQLLEQRFLTNDLELFKNKSRMDGLTQVLNRAAFMELAPEYLSRADNENEPLSMIMLDIDHFKDINDKFGHQAGDTVLANMGKILVSKLRRDDVIARYGGEEFIILIPGSVKEKTRIVAEKLRKSVAEHKFENLPQITISLGYTDHHGGEELDEMISRADTALYSAKDSGRNAVREG